MIRSSNQILWLTAESAVLDLPRLLPGDPEQKWFFTL